MRNWVSWVIVLGIVALLLNANAKAPASLPPAPVAAHNADRAVPYDAQKKQQQKAGAPARPRALSFGGYPCRSDCSDHRAGYIRASRHGIADPDSCAGPSSSFAEGCRVYAEERSARAWNR